MPLRRKRRFAAGAFQKSQAMKKTLLTAVALLALASASAASLDGKKVAVYIDGASVGAVANNQEREAAQWLLNNDNAAVAVTADDIENITPATAEALWIHIDRCGIGAGSANLPAPFNNSEFVGHIKEYVKAGGNLLLTKQATQLATAIGRIDKEVNNFSSGDGGDGFDTWTVQNVYGVSCSEQLDRSGHAIYAGLETVNDYNNVPTVALLGTGDPATSMWREDHNCFWIPADLGFGEGNGTPACITEFEKAYNCVCLGTWGHVGDFCGAGIIDFEPTGEFKGRVIAIGLAAYEWAPRNGGNGFHSNIQNMTSNALNLLALNTTGIESAVSDADVTPEYYNLQGIRVAEPVAGAVYIERRGSTVKKVIK